MRDAQLRRIGFINRHLYTYFSRILNQRRSPDAAVTSFSYKRLEQALFDHTLHCCKRDSQNLGGFRGGLVFF
jgi:hypothetical protein